MWLPLLLISLSLQATDFGAEGIKALEQEKYEKAVEKDPNDYGARFHLALANSMVGKKPEAIAGYEKVLELKPGLYEADLNLGILFVDQKQFEKAEAHL